MKLQGTPACTMRDELIKARYANKITLKEITDKLCKTYIPEWLQSDILKMVKHNQYKRITCAVELAMQTAVCVKILDEILKEDKKKYK